MPRHLGGDRCLPPRAVNQFGLHDMHGNVSEWVQDCSHSSYDGAPSDGSQWEEGGCSNRVLRGGAWDRSAPNLRSAKRMSEAPTEYGKDMGFRVARSLDP